MHAWVDHKSMSSSVEIPSEPIIDINNDSEITYITSSFCE